MNSYYVTFRSMTGAQRSANILQKAGISASMMRTPQNMATEGCGYTVKLRGDKVNLAMQMLKKGGAGYGKVFVQSKGGYDEVIF